MHLGTYTNYRELLRGEVGALKARHGRSKSFANLAAHCGIQKTYLSQVLAARANLSADQAFLAAEFLELEEADLEYFVTLHQRDVCRQARRKAFLERKL